MQSGHTGPALVRNVVFPEGFLWLLGNDKRKAEVGTALIRKSPELIALAHSLHLPWLLELPEFLGVAGRGLPASLWDLGSFS